MRNNPIRYSDPTGHKACTLIDTGECDETEEKTIKLVDYFEQQILNDKKTKIKDKYTSLDAMLKVVNKAARLFGKDWEGFLDATSYVFTGYAGHGYDAMWKARGNIGLIDGDSGFHFDFRDPDSSQQVRHFWAGFATAANPTGNNPAGELFAYIGNDIHEITQDTLAGNDGATVIDYALTMTAIDIAMQVGNEVKTPLRLVQILDYRLGADGPGYIGPPIPTDWWLTPFD